MKKEKVFVVGDIHGQAKMLEKILKHWNEKEEQLVLLGDLADRGPDSKKAIELAYDLVLSHQAIVLKGNHEDLLEKYLKNPEEHHLHYYMNGGEKTLRSLLGAQLELEAPWKNARKVQENYSWLIPFLESLPYYYEWKDYLFVHAGVDLSLENWKDSTKRDLIWIREGFFDHENKTDKQIIFGHTITPNLHGDLSNFEIWQSGDGLIGIDGGAVYGGKLHALRLSETEIEAEFSVDSKMN